MAIKEVRVVRVSTHRELGLSRWAQVFHLGSDRLVLDPEDYRDKVRVRLDRRPNATGGYVTKVDQYREVSVEAVMVDLAEGFRGPVARAVALFRAGDFKARRR